MKVIVAGLPKTGTKSLHWALEILGYSVYDYLENSTLLTKEYEKILRDGWEIDDFRRMYENVDSAMDFPIPMFWEEISKAFPDAKIVLMVRENEEVWLKSFLKQMELVERNVFFRLMLVFSPTFARGHRVIGKLGQIYFGTASPMSAFSLRRIHYNKSMLKRAYITHNAYVMQNAPKEKLLVYRCSEGWEPLCKFLGVPIPDVPFPHKNKGGNMLDEAKELPELREIKREMALTFTLFLTTTAATGFCLWRFGISGIVDSARHCVGKLMQ